MEAGYRLRKQRLALNLRLRHVAAGTGWSVAHISSIERGLAGSPEDRERIAAFLRQQSEFPIPDSLPCIE
jgi:transcriptional regulator with XRE-family HTH domain